MTSTSQFPDPSAVLAIIRNVAACEIMPRFRNLAPGDITSKSSPNDLVTIADVAAERRLVERLDALTPGCAFVGEEAVEGNPALLSALAGDRPVWLLDPVDGTNNFASGKACFAVIVAYCARGETQAGWIYDPIADVAQWSVAGEGAWSEGADGRTRLRTPPPPAAIGEMRGSAPPRAIRHLSAALVADGEPSCPRFERYGCVGREYMDLASGRLHFAKYARLKPWDHAAGVLIHREAGGFGALRRNASPYRPLPVVGEDALLLAPDAGSWDRLDRLLG
ncbi:MAG: inositol monophosphatase [Rhodospirillales bacterium]|nr:inositol monophosphatase [Rhodospirillales bacterium]